jgi:hypothetical protein
MLGDVTLVLLQTLWAASLAKGADTLFRYSVNDATTQILYLPAPAQVRVSAKAFIDGVVKPMSIGVAGCSSRCTEAGWAVTRTGWPGSRWSCASAGSPWWSACAPGTWARCKKT